MNYRVELSLADGTLANTRATLRYDVLERVATCTRGRGVVVLAFGLGPGGLRLVVRGDEDQVRTAMHGLRCGTARKFLNARVGVVWDAPQVRPADHLTDAVRWAHAAVDGEPLASPWCSARDLAGFRHARFFDAALALRHVDASDAAPPVVASEPEALVPLHVLLRLAASVLGVLPADRASFRLFAHLGRRLGFHADALAEALSLTSRRIRQLLHEREPLVDTALICLADDRLAVVP